VQTSEMLRGQPAPTLKLVNGSRRQIPLFWYGRASKSVLDSLAPIDKAHDIVCSIRTVGNSTHMQSLDELQNYLPRYSRLLSDRQ
jgi:hypothetical protein